MSLETRVFPPFPSLMQKFFLFGGSFSIENKGQFMLSLKGFYKLLKSVHVILPNIKEAMCIDSDSLPLHIERIYEGNLLFDIGQESSYTHLLASLSFTFRVKFA